MEIGLLLIKVVVILFVGFIGSLIVRKFKLLNVLGYLVFGLFIGLFLGFIFFGYEGFIISSD